MYFVCFSCVAVTVNSGYSLYFLLCRKLEFVGEQSKKESIPVDKIETIQIMASETDQQGQ